jgi:phenylpropionate dioxygenase-like ring-hydroxylating dioxygenase large terminal subunit
MSIEGKLAARVGPILADGTPIRDLIDLDKREVSFRVMYDPEIYRLELERIFAREWLPLGHESEIPEPGDFITRNMGEDPVIVSRSRDGEIAISLNVCAHRGMRICRADFGNAETFKCPYHGWVYDGGSGRLRGAPFEQEMYGQDWDKSQFGLPQARVATRLGVIFGSFGANTPPLDEYLGEMGWYLDRFFGTEKPEFKAAGAPYRFRVASNWKLGAEQAMGDAYHVKTLHESARQLGFSPGDDARSLGLDAVKVAVPEGYLVGLDRSFSAEYNKELTDGGAIERYGDPADWSHVIAGLYPTALLTGVAVPVEGGRTHQVLFGAFDPCGPGAMQLNYLSVLASDAPEAVRAQAAKMDGLIMGVINTDDSEVYPDAQRAAGGAVGQKQTLKYNAVAEPFTPEGWPGPGTVYAGFTRDDTQWMFWLRWLESMTTEG